MRILMIFLGLLVNVSATAEVFKCVGKAGKVIYQSRPCEAAIKSQQLDISRDPNNESKAQANLEAVRNEYETRKAAQQQAEKEAAEQRRVEEQLEYARRSSIAQQEQAEAQKRQAEAMERQNNGGNRPLYILPTPHRPHLPQPPREPHPLSPHDTHHPLKQH